MSSGWIKKYKSLGLLGLCDKFFVRLKKRALWIWYIKRFAKTGKSVVFEGTAEITGGSGIKLGSNIVFGKNVKIQCSEEAELVIGDGCYIADNVLLTSKKRLVIGKGTKIHEGSIVGGEIVEIGDDVWISRFCTVEGTDVVVEKESILSPFVFIIDTNHYIDKETGKITMDKGDSAPIRVRQNVWICNGSKVLKGVNIGSGSVIGAGSVVTRDVPERSVAAGIPAKVIKKTVG